MIYINDSRRYGLQIFIFQLNSNVFGKKIITIFSLQKNNVSMVYLISFKNIEKPIDRYALFISIRVHINGIISNTVEHFRTAKLASHNFYEQNELRRFWVPSM